MSHRTQQMVRFGIFGGMLLVLLFAAPLFWRAAEQVQAAENEAAQIVVKMAPGVDVTAVNLTYQTSTVRPLLASSGIYLLQGSAGQSTVDLIASMDNDARLLHVEEAVIGAAPESNSRDTYAWPDGETEDLRLMYEWEYGGQNAAHYEAQPAVHQLALAGAHAYSRGAGVVVAVLDTGIDLTHPLLADRLTAVRYDFVDDDAYPAEGLNGLDDDGDGFIDEAAGHGTHIAGIVRLVAPEAMLMPLRVLDSDGQGYAVVIAEAIRYAATNGADVINLSLGTAVSSPALQAAIADAAAAGVVVIGAAGNLNTAAPQYPAAYPCAIAVTAVNQSTLIKAGYASYGPWVNVAAPGERIYSTYLDSSFAWWKGTSMATPFVAGQAALLLGHTPSLTPAEVGDLIGGAARQIDRQNPAYSGQLGNGRIQPVVSLQMLDTGQRPSTGVLQGCGE